MFERKLVSDNVLKEDKFLRYFLFKLVSPKENLERTLANGKIKKNKNCRMNTLLRIVVTIQL